MKENELKPCPFCGGEAVSKADGYIHCSECSCRIGTWLEWNTRKTITEGEIRELREALKNIVGMCKHCGDFSNGVEMSGIDEGIAKSDEIIKQAEQALAQKGGE